MLIILRILRIAMKLKFSTMVIIEDWDNVGCGCPNGG
jgi:hypothetical protein